MLYRMCQTHSSASPPAPSCVKHTHLPLPPPQALADKKKGITDEDLLALVGDEVHQAAVVWELVDLQVRQEGVQGGRGGHLACGIWQDWEDIC